jgi:hypothetical protein
MASTAIFMCAIAPDKTKGKGKSARGGDSFAFQNVRG